jgi:hypothetical protein
VLTTHPPIQWVLGALSLQVKRLDREPDTHLYLMLNLRMNGPIPLLPHMPACHAQEQLYRCLCFMLYEDIAFGTN